MPKPGSGVMHGAIPPRRFLAGFTRFGGASEGVVRPAGVVSELALGASAGAASAGEPPPSCAAAGTASPLRASQAVSTPARRRNAPLDGGPAGAPGVCA